MGGELWEMMSREVRGDERRDSRGNELSEKSRNEWKISGIRGG